MVVRLNYNSVTKSYVFTDHFNQCNFHFCENTNAFIYFRYELIFVLIHALPIVGSHFLQYTDLNELI